MEGEPPLKRSKIGSKSKRDSKSRAEEREKTAGECVPSLSALKSIRLVKESPEIVFLSAGDPPVTQPFHKSLLCNRSPYFRALFNGDFEEAGRSTHHVRNYDFVIVQDFYAWLYTRCLPPVEYEANGEPSARVLTDLFRLYCFAEYVQVKYLGDHILSHIMRNLRPGATIGLEIISNIYDSVSAHAPLQKFLVDCVLEHHLPAAPAAPARGFVMRNGPLNASLSQAVMTELLSKFENDDNHVKFDFKLKRPKKQLTRDCHSCRYHGHIRKGPDTCPWFGHLP